MSCEPRAPLGPVTTHQYRFPGCPPWLDTGPTAPVCVHTDTALARLFLTTEQRTWVTGCGDVQVASVLSLRDSSSLPGPGALRARHRPSHGPSHHPSSRLPCPPHPPPAPAKGCRDPPRAPSPSHLLQGLRSPATRAQLDSSTSQLLCPAGDFSQSPSQALEKGSLPLGHSLSPCHLPMETASAPRGGLTTQELSSSGAGLRPSTPFSTLQTPPTSCTRAVPGWQRETGTNASLAATALSCPTHRGPRTEWPQSARLVLAVAPAAVPRGHTSEPRVALGTGRASCSGAAAH